MRGETALSPLVSPDDHSWVDFPGSRLTGPGLFQAAAVVAERVVEFSGGQPAKRYDRTAAGPRTDAEPVAVLATASAHTVVAVLGCVLAGVPVVPIPPDSGPAERDHILSDSGARLVLGADSVDLAARSAFTMAEPPASSTALILYTSGTTGPPKGVLLSRAAIAAGLDGLAAAWEWTASDTLAHGLPLFHVHGLILGVLGPLRFGSRLIHTGRPNPAGYATAAAAGASMFFGVPTVWSRICAEPDAAAALRSARLLVSGSAPLPASVFTSLTELTGHAPVERYGMTETMITLSTRAGRPRRPGVVGWPLDGVETRLGTDDELEVRGPTLFDGYLNRPDATAANFTTDGWFKTGDVAAIEPDGAHRIIGRASVDLIKSGGYRIGAGEVEDALLSHPDVQEVAVVGLPDADLGQAVTAFVVLADARTVSDSALIDYVAQQLSIHKRPRRVIFVSELPRNAMGKVVKTALMTNR